MLARRKAGFLKRISQAAMDEASKKWIVVYPLYLDKARSVSGGRRVPAALAVEKPQAEEIAQVLK